ncbi:NAD-binding protein [Natrinema sp. 1APR25-10V2]|uniref:NAD(P)-binding protein n=1 Tax=Natrinema sp. 1APR25-10V2 TaxID=2951081 RepID=UPI002874C17A|nr:NAD-binding protein [Natrinema sp. 1APR25-10V2]MDS0476797.1 NAD-binding protein [Natrinema sp. 1APR25-10V2]
MANSTVRLERSTPILQRAYIVIDDSVGLFLAERLASHVETIVVNADDKTAASAERVDLETRQADVTDSRSLALAGLSDAELVIVASESDARNILVAQICRTTFGVTDIAVRLSDPRNANAFKDIDVETVCIASTLTDAIVTQLGI